MRVSDLDACLEHALKLGAEGHMLPTNIPAVGRIAPIEDQQGAAI
jgi:predicted enzyme related to lactoylglutathione lyase